MQPNEIKYPLIGMQDGRFVRVSMIAEDLGPQDDVLREVAQAAPTTIMNAFKIGELQFSIQVKAGVVTTFTQLPRINIVSTFNIVPATGEVYPVFKPVPTPGTTEFESSQIWEPAPFGCKLYLVIVSKHSSGNYVFQNAFLIAREAGGKGMRRPPFPNLYNDGRICMGHTAAGNNFGIQSQSLDLLCGGVLTHIDSSRWNTDLLEGMTTNQIRALFSFKDGKSVPPPTGFKWWEMERQCALISSQFYSELPIA